MTFSQYLVSAGTGIEIIGVLMIAWPSVLSFARKILGLRYQTLPGQARIGLWKRTLVAKVGLRASMDAKRTLAPNPSIDRVVEWVTEEISRTEQRLVTRMDVAIAKVDSNTQSEIQTIREVIDYELSELSSKVGGVAKHPNVRGWGVGVAIFGLGVASLGSFVSAGA